jgi:hypothetical protein
VLILWLALFRLMVQSLSGTVRGRASEPGEGTPGNGPHREAQNCYLYYRAQVVVGRTRFR